MKEYSGQYAVKIVLAESAFNISEVNKKIRDGELEKIILGSEGLKSLFKWAEGEYQNVALFNNAENALKLVESVNKLSYVKRIVLDKDGIRQGFQRYIPVD